MDIDQANLTISKQNSQLKRTNESQQSHKTVTDTSNSRTSMLRAEFEEEHDNNLEDLILLKVRDMQLEKLHKFVGDLDTVTPEQREELLDYLKRRDQQDKSQLSEIIDILVLVRKYGQSCIKRKQQNEKGDKKRFETELKYFIMWFKQREEMMSRKYDYFYGPYYDEKERDQKKKNSHQCRTLSLSGLAMKKKLGFNESGFDDESANKKVHDMSSHNHTDHAHKIDPDEMKQYYMCFGQDKDEEENMAL